VRFATRTTVQKPSTNPVLCPFDINFNPVVETATSEIVYKFNWGH